MIGKACIGSIVIGSSSGRSPSRVMHINRGLPLTLGGAGPTLAGLAVPADSKIRGLLGLDRMHGIKHDHAIVDLDGVVDEVALRRVRHARFGRSPAPFSPSP